MCPPQHWLSRPPAAPLCRRAVLLDHSPEGGDAVAVLCNASGSPFVLCAFASGALLALDAAAAAVSRHALGRLEGPPTALACHPADEALLVAQVPAGLTTLCGQAAPAWGWAVVGRRSKSPRCGAAVCSVLPQKSATQSTLSAQTISFCL